jgi:mRNA-degrading endonuclease RelE of RelBE toxin-antitoxin system
MSAARRRQPVVFDPAASEELFAAVAWYDKERKGLGDEFLLEVRRAVHRVEENPEAWAPLSRRSRRCRVRRFPYGVIYQILPTRIRVMAVAHLHREPGYWKKRARE